MKTRVAFVVEVADTLIVFTPFETVGFGNIPQLIMLLLMFNELKRLTPFWSMTVFAPYDKSIVHI